MFLPRSLVDGALVIRAYPEGILEPGQDAVFGAESFLPEGEYRIEFSVDPAGVELDRDGASIQLSPAVMTLRVNADGTLTIDDQEATSIALADSISSNGSGVIGVARSWILTVSVVDPYTGRLENVAEEVFAFRVQWTGAGPRFKATTITAQPHRGPSPIRWTRR